MKHFMKLNKSPFESIANGEKTIELRLYDEKRSIIKVGDEIEFSETDNESNKILTKVIALHRFNTFKELYNSLPLTKCGYTPENVSIASYKDMQKYYSPEKEAEYGVVGIEITKL